MEVLSLKWIVYWFSFLGIFEFATWCNFSPSQHWFIQKLTCGIARAKWCDTCFQKQNTSLIFIVGKGRCLCADGGGGNEICSVDLVHVLRCKITSCTWQYLATMQTQRGKLCWMYDDTAPPTIALPTWLLSMPPWNPHPSSHVWLVMLQNTRERTVFAFQPKRLPKDVDRPQRHCLVLCVANFMP